jgi:hypothetical protein
MNHTFVTGTVLKSDSYEKTNTTVTQHTYENRKTYANGLSFSNYETYENVNVTTERFKEVMLLADFAGFASDPETRSVTLPGDFPLMEGHAISLAYDDGQLLYVFNHDMKKKSYIGPSRLRNFYNLSKRDETEFESNKSGILVGSSISMFFNMLITFGSAFVVNGFIVGAIAWITTFIVFQDISSEKQSGLFLMSLTFGFLALMSKKIVTDSHGRLVDLSIFPDSIKGDLIRDVHAPCARIIVKWSRIVLGVASVTLMNKAVSFELDWLSDSYIFFIKILSYINLMPDFAHYSYPAFLQSILILVAFSVVAIAVAATILFSRNMAKASTVRVSSEYATNFREAFNLHLVIFQPVESQREQ